LGAVVNPINFRLSAREVALILNDSGAVALFCHTDFSHLAAGSASECPGLGHVVWIGRGERPALHAVSVAYEAALGASVVDAALRVESGVDDLAHLYYTSGTTGKPKGVMLTHGNVMFHALAAIAELGLSDADTWAHVAPMFHLADAWATFALTWVGGKHVFVPYFNSAT